MTKTWLESTAGAIRHTRQSSCAICCGTTCHASSAVLTALQPVLCFLCGTRQLGYRSQPTCDVVRYYPRGMVLFTAQPEQPGGIRKRVGPIRWPVLVYRDDSSTTLPAAFTDTAIATQQQELLSAAAYADGQPSIQRATFGTTRDSKPQAMPGSHRLWSIT